MVEYTSPVSFVWDIVRRSKDDISVYCFAYVRHKETNEILYAGVKYVGSEEKFGKLRKNLRNTAVVRLLRKPIYAVYVLKDGEKVNDVLPRFFVKSGMRGYSNVGIYAKEVDLRFYYNREGDMYGKSRVSDGDMEISLKYGFWGENGEMRMITEGKTYIFGKSYEGIYNLRRRAMFYGSGKERRRLEDYCDLGDEYLKQFGIMRKNRVEERRSILEDYHRVNDVKYFKAMMNKRMRLHVAFMRVDEWVDYVSRVYDRDMEVNVRERVENVYCFAYSVEDIGKVDKRVNRRELHKRIVVERLIERPIVVGGVFFEGMSMKERRIWFFSRFGLMRGDSIGKWNDFNLYLEGEDEILQYKDYSESIRTYKIDKGDKPSFLGRLMMGIQGWIDSR